MSKIYTLIFCLLAVVGLNFYNVSALDYCYSDGCFTMYQHDGSELNFISMFSSIYNMADYFRYYWGRSWEIGSTTLLPMSCSNGSYFVPNPACAPNCNVCPNGTSDYPTCSTCPTGQAMLNGSCHYTCYTTDPCGSGTTISGISDTGTCIPLNPTTNTQYSQCSKTNVCGQVFKGYTCPTGCTAGGTQTDINNSCISSFNTSADSVNPNGSVQFSWSLVTPPTNVGRKCGFVDLTTPTPRPIPGLQNLDPNLDKTRISNIQTTTRFCLVCQFYSLLDNSILGTAQQHQWIRVIRVGEN